MKKRIGILVLICWSLLAGIALGDAGYCWDRWQETEGVWMRRIIPPESDQVENTCWWVAVEGQWFIQTAGAKPVPTDPPRWYPGGEDGEEHPAISFALGDWTREKGRDVRRILEPGLPRADKLYSVDPDGQVYCRHLRLGGMIGTTKKVEAPQWYPGLPPGYRLVPGTADLERASNLTSRNN